jgi:hypothetical protein
MKVNLSVLTSCKFWKSKYVCTIFEMASTGHFILQSSHFRQSFGFHHAKETNYIVIIDRLPTEDIFNNVTSIRDIWRTSHQNELKEHINIQIPKFTQRPTKRAVEIFKEESKWNHSQWPTVANPWPWKGRICQCGQLAFKIFNRGEKTRRQSICARYINARYKDIHW